MDSAAKKEAIEEYIKKDTEKILSKHTPEELTFILRNTGLKSPEFIAIDKAIERKFNSFSPEELSEEAEKLRNGKPSIFDNFITEDDILSVD